MVETIQNVTNSTSKLDMIVSLPQNNGAHTIHLAQVSDAPDTIPVTENMKQKDLTEDAAKVPPIARLNCWEYKSQPGC